MEKVDIALHMTLNTFHRLDIAQGVIQYAREQPCWRVHGGFYTSQPILNYKTWQGDGIVALCHTRNEAKDILATDLPIVDVIHGFTDNRIVNVTSDHDASGRIAGLYLRELGFTRFAFCHISDTEWSRMIWEAFSDTVGVSVGKMPVFGRHIRWWQNHTRSKSLERFVLSLSPRTAILAGNDNAGVKITAACLASGRRVPDDLAVLGNGGDSLLCELSHPSLSTIPNNGLRIGYEAARRLHELMRGWGTSRDALRIPPERVMPRFSTNTIVCNDEAVRKALMFIRWNFTSNLSVADVAREATVCRRTLEMRFRNYLDRSVLEEIQATRLRQAVELLEDSDLPINKIHRRCGFMSHQVFYNLFKKRYGVTPQEYRKRRGEISMATMP